jgi:hypothetical protein
VWTSVKCSARDLAPPADFQDGMYQKLAEKCTKNFNYHYKRSDFLYFRLKDKSYSDILNALYRVRCVF